MTGHGKEPGDPALETLDDLLHGELKLLQHRQGYRYSVDALLLAAFALPLANGAAFVDLGCGPGTVGLIIAKRGKPSRALGVEVQPGLADLAKRNAENNRTDPGFEVIEADALALPGEFDGAFDLAVTNPPFRKRLSGRVSPNAEKAIARHELKMDLPSWLAKAGDLIRPGGAICMVYPTSEEPRLDAAVAGSGLSMRRRQYALDRPGGRARLVLIELRGEDGDIEEMDPVAIERDGKKYSLDGYR